MPIDSPGDVSIGRLPRRERPGSQAAPRSPGGRTVAEDRTSELALLVETCQDAIITRTAQGIITFCNAAAERLYGYTAQEMIGRHVSMLTPPERRDEVAGLQHRIDRGQRIKHLETVRTASDGRLLNVDESVWPIRNRAGTITGAYSIVRDVADRMREDALRAGLHQDQRHIALTLQNALMRTPSAIPGTRVASRYLPSTRGHGVGGDWFDLVPLGAGRVGVIIGDVMGRGLDAAVVMGQLRSAARALALAGLEPSELMRALDAFTTGLPEQLVTCAYLRLDPARGELTACSAGHLPILLVTPDGRVDTLPVPVSVPLGVGQIAHHQVLLPLPTCSTLALYTDGLIETPRTDLDDRLLHLTDTLRTAFATTRELEHVADRVLQALLPDAAPYADDVTLLLISQADTPAAKADQRLSHRGRSGRGGRATTPRIS
ncbi:PP2C family protein-serine/threonine phosphatase [Streptomyces beijiangensis]|uniref:SpoIIE family protein phosphatase n=1 Tax=Streptomyces beijiangensis TaxID=163361 RepID=A0A939F753_9ACTN|nr:SpoIIE family protein phosphatase [Streptomyces beijiangensis]MBO0513307.1 SpoIIE family protein phosphatase [Streptomyces beijiangensis]